MAKKQTKQKEEKSNEMVRTALRGRSFQGEVIKKFNDRLTIQFERLLYLRKYESYEKRRTKIHARIPIELRSEINVGDYIEVKECRPLSKIIHFIVTKKIRSKDESNISKSN